MVQNLLRRNLSSTAAKLLMALRLEHLIVTGNQLISLIILTT